MQSNHRRSQLPARALGALLVVAALLGGVARAGVRATQDPPAPQDLQEQTAARLGVLEEERRSVGAEDPRREARLRLIDLEYAILQERLVQLQEAASHDALAPSVTVSALDDLRARRDAARDALDRLDEEAEVAELRTRSDLEGLRRAVDERYGAPLVEAQRRRAEQAKQLEAARARREAQATVLADIRTRLEGRRRELALVEASLAATTDVEERGLLQRNVDVLRLAVELLTEREAFLPGREPFLDALVQRRELELQTTQAEEERLQRLDDAAQGVLDALIQEKQEDATGRLEYLASELARAQEPHVVRRLRWQIADAELELSFATSVGLRETLEKRVEDLEAAKLETRRLAESLDGTGPKPGVAGASVRDTIAGLQRQVNRAEHRAALTALRRDRERWAASLAQEQAALDGLDDTFRAEREAAGAELQETGRAEEWPGEDARWVLLKQARRDVLERRLELFRDLVAGADAIERLLVEVFAERREALIRIQRANLFLRTDSRMTLAKVKEGLEDLALLPGRALEFVRGAPAYVQRPGTLAAIVWSGVLTFLLAGLAWFVDRRFAARLARLRDLEDEDRSERAALVLVRLARVFLRGAAIYVAFAIWSLLLPDLSFGAAGVLREVGFALGLLWFLKRCVLELLEPDARGRLLLPLDLESARRARRVGLGLVYLSAIFVPAIQALRGLYDNAGARDALVLLYQLLVVAALLSLLSRRSTLAGFLPKGQGSAARLARRVLQLLYPVLVLGVPGLLVLDLLRFDILAGLIARVSILTLIVALATYLLYLGAQYLIDSQLEAGEEDDEDEEPELVHEYGGARVLAHFVLRLVAIVGGVTAALLLAGSSLADVEGFLSIPLPMQDPAGGQVVTLWDVLVGLVLLTLTVQGVRHVRGALQTLILPRTRLDVGLQYTIATIVGYALMAGGLALALGQVFALERLGYVVAALSIGIGFGLQEIVSNFISGLILLFERPLRVGDMVEVGGTDGVVKRIQIRSTTVQTRDNVWILVPNKDLITQNVTNYVYTDPKMRIHVSIGVAYGTETALVRKALLEVAREHGKVLRRPGPEVWFVDFGDSALVFELLCWVADPINRWRIMSDLRYAIDASFRRYGIQIPFPQRDLHVRSVDAPFRMAGPEDAVEEPGGGGVVEA